MSCRVLLVAIALVLGGTVACSSVPPEPRVDASLDGGGPEGPEADATGADGVGSDADQEPPLDLGKTCDPDAGAAACEDGQLCCVACCKDGEPARCVDPDVDGECPLPDLMVDEEVLLRDLQVASKYIAPESCAIVEGCVNTPGQRRLLRFSTMTPNIGTADMVLGTPDTSDGNFEYSSCHDHFHFVHYARYRLLDMDDNEVGVGRKQAFCLLDSRKYLDDAVDPVRRFSCTNQGIHKGWADVYGAGLDCQWLDVTDLPDGDYQLEVHLNPERILVEKNYDNNLLRVPVRIEGNQVPVDPTEACPPVSGHRGATRECGWTVARRGKCLPGSEVAVGCNSAPGCGLGSCEGNTVLRVCAGNEACPLGVALASNDDACGKPGTPNRCSFATFECPAVGDYTVMTGSHDPAEEATCNLEVR